MKNTVYGDSLNNNDDRAIRPEKCLEQHEDLGLRNL